jgi:hypothetical protein
VVLVSAVLLAALVALGGIGAPLQMLTAMSVQLTRSAAQTPWAVVGSAPLQQLVQATTLAPLAAACVRIRRDDELATRSRPAQRDRGGGAAGHSDRR